MIGVQANASDRELVEEFFQLFKTSWEFLRPGVEYPVVLLLAGEPPRAATRLLVVYSGEKSPAEPAATAHARDEAGTPFSLFGHTLPVYGPHVIFPAEPATALTRDSGHAATQLRQNGPVREVRVGYDLVEEIRFLLRNGQPVPQAAHPALELHIALLRQLILDAGLPVVEIPPTPAGYELTVCLTHDIDHPVAKNHGFDHTTLGLLYRATIGSVVDVVTGHRPARDLGRNFAAAVQFPLAQFGLAPDPWKNFSRYTEVESGLGATYFVIPHRGRPGRRRNGSAPAKRAACYSLQEVKPELDRAASAGCEIGLHGIDAWMDAESATNERKQIESVGLAEPTGLRMHWLYFDADSPAALDKSGFAYDSTFGYNQTVGYRAGTTQVFRPPGTKRLLELPLHIMDTALFYPSYLHLRPREAHQRVDAMIDQAGRFGGVLTFNWHDRSIAPERLWEKFYAETLHKLRARRTWFPTAAKAVGWFRQRRDASLAVTPAAPGKFNLRATTARTTDFPPLTVRVYKPQPAETGRRASHALFHPFTDTTLEQSLELEISL